MGGDERLLAANANSMFLPLGVHCVRVPPTLTSVLNPLPPRLQRRLHGGGTRPLPAVRPPATDGAHHRPGRRRLPCGEYK